MQRHRLASTCRATGRATSAEKTAASIRPPAASWWSSSSPGPLRSTASGPTSRWPTSWRRAEATRAPPAPAARARAAHCRAPPPSPSDGRGWHRGTPKATDSRAVRRLPGLSQCVWGERWDSGDHLLAFRAGGMTGGRFTAGPVRQCRSVPHLSGEAPRPPPISVGPKWAGGSCRCWPPVACGNSDISLSQMTTSNSPESQLAPHLFRGWAGMNRTGLGSFGLSTGIFEWG